MAGTWSHDWHGDVLVIKTAGSMSYDEAAACTAATMRMMAQAPARFAIVADLTEYPPQPPENDQATRPSAQAMADAQATGQLVGVALVTAKMATKLQVDRWGREVGTANQSAADVTSAIETMRQALADAKV